MAVPMRRAAVTDTATEAAKNAWSRARATDLTAAAPPDPTTTPHPPPDPPQCPMVPRGGGDSTFKDGPCTSEANHREAAADPGVSTLWAVDLFGPGLLSR